MLRKLTVSVLCCCAIGCSESDANDQGPTTRLGADLPAGPAAFDPDFAASTDFFSRMSAPRKGLSTSPHGVVRIWYSANIEPVIAEAAFVVPVGTVAIKTQDQNDDDQVDNIMVMIKQAPGSSPKTSDWLFERYFGDASLDVSGGATLGFCASCHNGFSETAELGGTTLSD